MLSRTSEYALRAVIHLAQHLDAWPISGREIAEQTGIPAKYLSTVLSELVRVGILESARGKSGGFRLVDLPKNIKLIEVLSPFEQFENMRCPFGSERCSDDKPCLAHDQWKEVVSAHQEFLCKTSIQDVSITRPNQLKVEEKKNKRG